MSGEQLSAKEFAEQLQQTIDQLQQLVVQLNRDSVDHLPPVINLQRLQETTQALTSSLNSPTIAEKKAEEVSYLQNPEAVELEEELEDFIEETADLPTEPASAASPKTIPSEAESGFLQRLLSPIRSILPTGINDSLSDGILIGILGAILTGVLVGVFLLISPQLTEPTPEIVESPPMIETPVELESPESPQAILIEPPPEPEISPEQRLIRAVQEGIDDLTSRYPEGLIDGIEAYFSESRLEVVMSDDWYQLRPSRQDDIAKGIFQKAKNLDFQKLELLNTQGEVLARSPVVGNQMIILLRNKA